MGPQRFNVRAVAAMSENDGIHRLLPSGLYPRLLGKSWRRLDDAIRRLHPHAGAIVQAVGVFHVRGGTNPLTRTLAWLAQLPAVGKNVEVRLLVTALEDGEERRRWFGARPLASLQSMRSDGLLAEQVGIVEMRFRLEVASGALHYLTRSAALCFGSLRIPLPLWFSPRVKASERPLGNPDHVYVTVEVILPVLGRLISYEGKLTIVEVQG